MNDLHFADGVVCPKNDGPRADDFCLENAVGWIALDVIAGLERIGRK